MNGKKIPKPMNVSPGQAEANIGKLIRDGLDLKRILDDGRSAGYAKVIIILHTQVPATELSDLVDHAKMLGYETIDMAFESEHNTTGCTIELKLAF